MVLAFHSGFSLCMGCSLSSMFSNVKAPNHGEKNEIKDLGTIKENFDPRGLARLIGWDEISTDGASHCSPMRARSAYTSSVHFNSRIEPRPRTYIGMDFPLRSSSSIPTWCSCS